MRLGVLDVGSNTVHLQVFETFPGSRPDPISNRKVEIRLAEYVSSDGYVSAEGIRRLRSAIEECLIESRQSNATDLLPFATSALRESKNGNEIIANINKDFEIDLQVLSGEEEASITFLAARRWYGWSSGRLLMIDIGGGSLELAMGVNESPDIALSLPLGALRLTKNFLIGDPFTKKSVNQLRDHVEDQLLQNLAPLIDGQVSERSIGTSKTLRTIARIGEELLDGNGLVIRVEMLRRMIPKLVEMSEAERAKLPGVSRARAKQIVAGAIVAESAMRQLEIEMLEICPWALREGIILKWVDWIKG